MKEVRFPERKEQRDAMRALGLCINSPMPSTIAKRPGSARVTHGAVVRGGKCQRCIDIHSPPDRAGTRSIP